jgi:hypothetical protein
MIRTLTGILILCLFITGCTNAPSVNMELVNSQQNADKPVADIIVRTVTGEGPDLTPTCSPVTLEESRIDSPNPYLQPVLQPSSDELFPPKPNNHVTPFVSNYTSY